MITYDMPCVKIMSRVTISYLITVIINTGLYLFKYIPKLILPNDFYYYVLVILEATGNY